MSRNFEHSVSRFQNHCINNVWTGAFAVRTKHSIDRTLNRQTSVDTDLHRVHNVKSIILTIISVSNCHPHCNNTVSICFRPKYNLDMDYACSLGLRVSSCYVWFSIICLHLMLIIVHVFDFIISYNIMQNVIHTIIYNVVHHLLQYIIQLVLPIFHVV